VLIAAAFCPQPPLLVPELAQGAAPQLDALRAACAAAVGRLYAAGPEILAVIGSVGSAGSGGPSQGAAVRSRGSFHRYGVDLAVEGGWPEPEQASDPDKAGTGAEMPLGHLVAAWLLRDHPTTPPREAFAVDDGDPAAGAADAAALGRALAERPERIALLVMGDGSASRTLKAPGHLDPRAEGYDEAVAKALATADHRALAALDPALSAELLVAGWPAWKAAAAAAAGSGRGYDAELLYDEAPYGVGYFVATWVEA
jgi:hypothetical protein